MKISPCLALLLILNICIAEEPTEREVSLMGTILRIHSFDSDRNRALQHTEAWIKLVEQTEEQWSNWRSTSEISQLNQHPLNSSFHLSEELCAMIPVLQRYNLQTKGAFDPGIAQLLKIWGFYDQQPRIPSKPETDQALEASGIQKISIDRKNCTATRTADVAIDAGAFGKGLAFERILDHAKTNKSAPFMADFGGQLLVYGTIHGAPWKAELAHPANREAGSGVWIHFQSGSVSSSGGSVRIGHIIDPKTGEPVDFNGSVAVLHESPLAADIFSTALYVLGPDKGIGWADKNHIAAWYLIDDSAKVIVKKSKACNNVK